MTANILKREDFLAGQNMYPCLHRLTLTTGLCWCWPVESLLLLAMLPRLEGRLQWRMVLSLVATHIPYEEGMILDRMEFFPMMQILKQ